MEREGEGLMRWLWWIENCETGWVSLREIEYGFGELEKKRWRGGGARVAGVAEAVKDAFF